VENLAIARVLAEIADLLELREENPFKVRAYRNAAETISRESARVADLPPERRLALPGIGKDIAARIGELVETGASPYHQALLGEFPATVLDLLNLQGVGPKTVALLYRELQVRSLEDLERAVRDGRVRAVKGMGAKKEAAILKALEGRARLGSRRLASAARESADALVAALRAHAPDAQIEIAGSLRRGCDTCGDVDIVAAGAEPSLMEAFTTYRLVERVLARGETKSSVLLWGGLQVDLRRVPRESAGAALQYFTGSKSHNIALRDRALGRGLTLNEYGLSRIEDGAVLAGADEDEIYRLLDHDPIPPELREGAGEIDAAARRALPVLVTRADLQGDLHMHTTASDGKADIETMARAALAEGHRYIAITDHSKSLAMANGLDEARTLEHARAVRAVSERLPGITLLAGPECDIRPDGTLDLDDECLASLDIVIASVHTAFNQPPEQMTARLLRAIANPWVDVLAHPTGRLILKREGYEFDLERVAAAAAEAGVALEINSQRERLDLRDSHVKTAKAAGARFIIDSDAHSPAALALLTGGVSVARRAGLTAADVLNTRPYEAFRASLRRARTRAGR
jgi:DNA polymerase (family 10)